MPRFITNRWWTFILALVLGLSLTLVWPAHDAHAVKLGNGITGTDGQGGGLPPPGNGDPDVPIGKTSALKPGVGAVQRPVSDFGVRAAGDSRTMLDSALMWRLQVVMRALRGFYFHL